jgi:4,5-DOPA dioxygenase extradiol
MRIMNTSLPPIFVSHGSPMIALEPGEAGAFMLRLGPAIDAAFGRPKAIVSVSAHTAARVPLVLGAARHEAIYDWPSIAASTRCATTPRRPALATG